MNIPLNLNDPILLTTLAILFTALIILVRVFTIRSTAVQTSHVANDSLNQQIAVLQTKISEISIHMAALEKKLESTTGETLTVARMEQLLERFSSAQQQAVAVVDTPASGSLGTIEARLDAIKRLLVLLTDGDSPEQK